MTPVALESLGADLVTLIWEAVVAGLGVSVAFSVALTATIKASEARSDGRVVGVAAWSVLAAVGYAAFALAAVYAIHIVTSK